jgi:hypothetical protein
MTSHGRQLPHYVLFSGVAVGVNPTKEKKNKELPFSFPVDTV